MPPPRSGPRLTARQERFVAEYGVDLNATQAAIRAGYSRKTARNIAAENLAKPYIADAIATQARARLQRIGLTSDMVMEAIRRQVAGDIRTLYQADGKPKPLHALSAEEASLILGVETILKNAEAGDGHTDRVHKLRLKDPAKYIELAARHFGLIEPEHAPPRPIQPLVIILEKRPAGWRGAGGRVVNGQVVPYVEPDEDTKTPT